MGQPLCPSIEGHQERIGYHGRGTHLFVASALSLVVAGAVTGCAGTHLRNAAGTTGPAKSASRIVLLSSNAAAPAIAALIPTCERAANVRVESCRLIRSHNCLGVTCTKDQIRRACGWHSARVR